MPTPHTAAVDDAFAEAVLLPGDPLRAQHIADTFLEDATRVTAVRNMFGFTGTYERMPVSVMGTGMGIPSSLIYATELIQTYGCRRLIRVGSCGAVQPDVALRDVVVGIGACTDSAVNRTRYGGWDFAAIADFALARAAVDAATERGLNVRTGNIHSTDPFYNAAEHAIDVMERMGVLAVEMEAAVLFTLGALRKVQAGCLLTVSDLIVEGEFKRISDEDLKAAVDGMTELALGTVTAER